MFKKVFFSVLITIQCFFLWSQSDEICNGSFEDSLTSWGVISNGAASVNTTISSAAAYSGNLGLIFEANDINPPASTCGLTSCLLNLEQGSYYRVSFWAKSDTQHPLVVVLQATSAPFVNYAEGTFTTYPTWTQYEFYTADSNAVAGLKLKVKPEASGIYYFDDFLMESIPALPTYTEVCNQDFEFGLSGWIQPANGGGINASVESTEVQNGVSSVKVITSSTSSGQPILSSCKSDIAENTTYEVSFWMKCDFGASADPQPHVVEVSSSLAEPPYTTYGFMSMSPSDSWTEYSFITQSDTTVYSNVRLAKFKFFNDGVYYIDNINIEEVTLSCNSEGVDVVSACDSYTWSNGITYTAGNYNVPTTIDAQTPPLFETGPNTTWTNVYTSCVLLDGNNGAEQTFVMNVTNLPPGGANYRVAKTVANGNWFNGNAQPLVLGLNTITVASVIFDRIVKFQFSSGAVEFDEVSSNGNLLYSSIPTQTFTNAAGCDSVVTLDLSINSVSLDLGADTLTICSTDSILLDAGAGFDSYSWNTGESTQTIYANSSGTYSATVSQGDAVVNDYSMSFDGQDDGIIGNALGLDVSNNNLLSVNAWINTNTYTPGTSQRIFSLSDNGTSQQYALNLDGDGKLYFLAGNGDFESNGFNVGSVIPLNTWTHVAMTYDGNAVRLYINGSLDFENIVSDVFPSDYNTQSVIGQRSDGAERFNGNIDDIHIWNTALNQSEIQNYMNCPPTGNEAGLVGYWNFEEGSGTTALDLTSNGNNGTINGATYDTDTPEQICNACSATDSVVVSILDPNITTYAESVCFGDSVELEIEDPTGNSLFFDGQDDYVVIENQVIQSVPLTFTANIFISELQTNNIILSKDNTWVWYIRNAFGSTQLSLYNHEQAGEYLNEYFFNPGEWYNVTITIDENNNIMHYVNGEAIPIFNPGPTMSPINLGNNENIQLGRWEVDDETLNGGLDNIQIWNQVLTESEIQQYMSCPPNGTESGLIGYWNFDEGSGTTTNDLTSNGNNGTINGAVYSTDVPTTCNSADVSWSTGETSSSIWVTPSQTTTYSVTVDDGIASCADNIEIAVNNPSIDLGADTLTICSADSLLLDAGAGFDSYSWNTGETTQSIYANGSGTYSATVSQGDAVVNDYSMSFDGQDDWIQINNDPTFDFSSSQQFTIQAYIKTNESSGYIFQSEYNYGYHLWVNSFGNIELTLWDGSTGIGTGNGNINVTDDNWHYVVGVYDGTNMMVYVDGVLDQTVSVGIIMAPINTSSPSSIGCQPSMTNHPDNFYGLIDQVSVWNTALSQSEIQNYMNCPPTGDEAGLVGYWNFEEGSGTTALDLTSNGNNGSINGATYDTDTPVQTCNSCSATDSVVVLQTPAIEVTDTQVACDSFTWIDGATYTANNNTSVFIYSATTGCDSTVTLDLTINNSSTATDVITACDSYTWIDGNTYTSSNNTATHTLTNSIGCDSVVTLDLIINNSSSSVDVVTACDTYNWIDGNTYSASNNTATFVTTNLAGCDSTILLNLTLNSANAGTDVITACDSYTWIDGNTYTSNNNSATHTLSNASGCDSIVTLDLTINNSNTGIDVIIACDAYTWIDGNTYTASNNSATHTLINAAGCDSIVSLDLTINNSNTGIDVVTACDTYTWIDGNTYTTSNNIATHTLTNSVGCDSVVTLDLTINSSNTGIDEITACDAYTWIDGNTYTASNNSATHILTNTAGCDSIVTLNLTVNSSYSTTDVQGSCDSYTWIDGNTYTSSNNTASVLLTSSAGCDSLVTLDLTIDSSLSSTDTQVACGSFTWIDGISYTANNNTATFLLTAIGGCDSLVTLNLTINSATAGVDEIVACDSYTWIDGNTYTENNSSATHMLTNSVGCDSLVTLDLTINNSNTGIDNITVCDAYTWIDGNTYTNSNNTATHTLSNAFGCDSVVTLNLTINSSSSSIDVVSQCGAYTWIDGIEYTESNNVATFVTTNAAGCDSTITLDLTILESSNSTDEHEACGAFTWIDGNTYTESNNSATFITTNASGCDSIITLALTLTILDPDLGPDEFLCANDSIALSPQEPGFEYIWNTGETTESIYVTEEGIYYVTVTDPETACTESDTVFVTEIPVSQEIDVQSACDAYTWLDGITYTESNNTATYIETSVVGCDSVVYTLNLTIGGPTCFAIPEGLSPNGDNTNDTWTIGGLNQYPDAVILVFNRWGNEVYRGDAFSDPWDGSFQGDPQPTADYYYILDLGDGQKFNGVVTLKR